jgi:hypothetical protein
VSKSREPSLSTTPKQLRNLGRRTVQRRPDQHAPDALVLRKALSTFEPVNQPRDRRIVVFNQVPDPRLLEVIEGRSYRAY